MYYKFGFERLEVWQRSRVLVKAIYGATKDFPSEEKYGITSQMQRSAVSIMANIAEGSSRFSKKEQSHFFQIAYSSGMETLSHLIIANDLEYISDEKLIEYRNQFKDITNMLNSLYKSSLRV
jgi:four helix bundle protein